MKKNYFIGTLIICFLSFGIIFSQSLKLKDYLNPKDVSDYKVKVKENAIYKDEMKFIVHNFEVSANEQFIDKGKIYRQFFKNGIYESFYSQSNKGIFKVSYWSDPTALITANIIKKEYCVETNINNTLFPMVLRGYAKILKSGVVEKKYQNIKFALKKLKTYKEKGMDIVSFGVTSEPKVLEGTIETLGGVLVLKGNIIIDNDLAKRSGFKLIFSHSDLPNTVKINLKFDYEYIDKKKPEGFMELGIDEIIKNYTKVDCD
ncbi:MAG: hypothetical protein HW421_1549 [Ignavibacteria bacterium]|nr:hypothetical protein [Ignavibacteria bacterium]